MKYSLDNGTTWLDAPNGEVRVMYDDQSIPGEDDKGTLYITATGEGLIMDVWTDPDPHSSADTNVGTSSETAEEIVARLVEANA